MNLELIQSKGFVIIPDVISNREVLSLVAAIEKYAEGIQPRGASNAVRNALALVPAIKQLAKSVEVRSFAVEILGSGAQPVRGIVFDKTPTANWKVAWHQDLTIEVKKRIEVAGYGPWSIKAGVYCVQPPVRVLARMLTVRIHLDDCDESNGALRVLSGSRAESILSREQIEAWKKRVDPVACCVPSGGVLLMRPLLVHASSVTQRQGHRRVIHIDYAAGELDGGLEWAARE